jgi:hypothetical protein
VAGGLALARARKKQGLTQMHADQKDARGFRLNRYCVTLNPAAIEAHHLRASVLIGVHLRFALFCSRKGELGH